MAEACRLGTSTESRNGNNLDENYCIFNVLCVFISLVTILADFTTDILVFAEYCKNGYWYWALTTMLFMVSPNLLINIFSLRWFVSDDKCTIRQWITHGFLVGLLERYIIFLHDVFSCKSLESVKTQKLISQRNDLALLHFLYIFTGTVPQIILQMYSIVILNDNYYTKVFALSASVASVIWGCVTYIYCVAAYISDYFHSISFLLRLTWHFGILIGRISGILLFTIIFGVWTLIPLGLHWFAMTFWIISLKTSFCHNKFKEIFYNAVMGFVYCFCYINLKEGHTRYFVMMFYTLIVTQNFGSLFLYVLVSEPERLQKSWSIAATVCDIFGTIIGILSTILYYRFFHSKGPISWRMHPDVELNNKVVSQTSCASIPDKSKDNHPIRSFKSSKNTEVHGITNASSQQTVQVESENADKKFLLDHWIARSGTPTFTSAPIGNISTDASSIELYSVENTPQSIISKKDKSHNHSKTLKKKICSPTELNLKLTSIENIESSIDEITSNNLNLQKRRGFCSSDELRNEFTNLNIENCNLNNQIKALKSDHCSEASHVTDGSNKKSSSDSIDMDLDLSFSDINSSDINTFNENIVQKLCLSALKNIKVGNQDADIENIQRIALDILKEMYTKKDKLKNGITTQLLQNKRDLDTPTEVLSVHDYENICAVNIAREAWGLRSWNGYCDIENWLHDGSVVRDRSRDTFTSGSSEISSCLSQELKNAILSAPSFPKKSHTYSNVFVRNDRSQEDYANTVICPTTEDFAAKPYIIDTSKDPNHLEPILEELDDLDLDLSNKKSFNSECSLVATIDEIRKATVTNSPRNLYHRRENQWDSPQFHSNTKSVGNLKKALWKDTCKLDNDHRIDLVPEKEYGLSSDMPYHPQLDSKELKAISDAALLDNDLSNCKTTPRKHKTTKVQNKGVNRSTEQLHDLSNKDIDFLWQLVSDNTLPVSYAFEDTHLSNKTPSLQSLIQKDSSPTDVLNTPTSKITNIKKNIRTKPRRKFSILRERFEPKSNVNCDKETLYYETEKIQDTMNINTSNVLKKCQDKADEIHKETYQSDVPYMSSYTSPRNIKDKRSLFMKQVLSPPKFNTKLKYKA
ncbi:uncharacterized protein LOC121737156 [Aricia agestis]|uniref:uncharacterized protein LOC121737156 n=1 Tax=Aricia agestis TaxID=91739 RepID=UPI001C20731B|nr:uncharacterized protein LOC121737156 [Aricia agestis]